METFVRMAISVAVLSSTAFPALADVSEASFTAQGITKYARVQESEVSVYVFKPEFKFRVIGVIEARGMAEASRSLLDLPDRALGRLLGDRSAQPGEKEDIALAMSALRREAAENGALGVVILRSVQVRVSDKATERRIVAAAIRPE